MPIKQLLNWLAERILGGRLERGFRGEVFRVAIGYVEDGGRWVDVLIVIPEVDVDGGMCPVEKRQGGSDVLEHSSTILIYLIKAAKR